MTENHRKQILKLAGGELDFSAGCLLMGILNVTPDSFSDGGRFVNVASAVEHAVRMAAEGASIIDVGAESSRPGSTPVDSDEQIRRVIPVIEGLSEKIEIPISIDTCNYEVASAALQAGACIINDITAMGDIRIGKLAAENEAAIVLMHMQGTPATMQQKPQYQNVVDEVLDFLIERAKKAEKLGVSKENIFIDPGIGFGKTLEHNLQLLRNLERFVSTGYRVLIGTSRKGFIGELTEKDNPADRTFGTAASVALCAAGGVDVVRVHDVAEMADVVKTAIAIKGR